MGAEHIGAVVALTVVWLALTELAGHQNRPGVSHGEPLIVTVPSVVL